MAIHGNYAFDGFTIIILLIRNSVRRYNIFLILRFRCSFFGSHRYGLVIRKFAMFTSCFSFGTSWTTCALRFITSMRIDWWLVSLTHSLAIRCVYICTADLIFPPLRLSVWSTSLIHFTFRLSLCRRRVFSLVFALATRTVKLYLMRC